MTRQKDLSEGLSMGLWSQWSPCSWPPEDKGASGCSRGAPLMCHHPFPMPLFPVESQGTQKEGEVLGALLLQEWLWILRDGGPSSMSAGFSTRRKKRRIVTSSPSRTSLNLEIATKALNAQTEGFCPTSAFSKEMFLIPRTQSVTNQNPVLQNPLEINIKCACLSGILTLLHRRDHCDAIRHSWSPRCRDWRGGTRAQGPSYPGSLSTGVGACAPHKFPFVSPKLLIVGLIVPQPTS